MPGTRRQELKQSHGGVLLPGLLSLLFIAPRSTVPGVVPPTWFDPSATITNLQPNLIETFPRMPSNPQAEAETQSLGLSTS